MEGSTLAHVLIACRTTPPTRTTSVCDDMTKIFDASGPGPRCHRWEILAQNATACHGKKSMASGTRPWHSGVMTKSKSKLVVTSLGQHQLEIEYGECRIYFCEKVIGSVCLHTYYPKVTVKTVNNAILSDELIDAAHAFLTECQAEEEATRKVKAERYHKLVQDQMCWSNIFLDMGYGRPKPRNYLTDRSWWK